MSARPPFSPEPEAYWQSRQSLWGDIVEEMRAAGFAVVVFNPDELEDADSRTVEDAMIEVGNETIGLLQRGVGSGRD